MEMLASLASLKLTNLSAAAEASSRDEASLYRRRLALAQGEIEGYACKLGGFQHALQELQMQLAEKDLQVAMLKSVIQDSDDHPTLECRLAEVLEHNMQLQQQLHKTAAQLAAAAAVASRQPCTEQHQQRGYSSSACSPWTHNQQQTDWQAMQIAMLRKALTMANMRLTAAGMMPVAATSDLLLRTHCDGTTDHSSTSFPISTPAATACTPPTSTISSRQEGVCNNSSSGSGRQDGIWWSSLSTHSSSRQDSSPAPGLPALCLFPRLSGISMEGTTTPLCAEAEQRLPSSGSSSSRCSSPAEEAEAEEAAAAAAGSGGCSVVGASSCAAGAEAAVAYSVQDADVSCYGADAGSDLLDDEDELGSVYLDNNLAASSKMVMDNPLFLHNRPETSTCVQLARSY